MARRRSDNSRRLALLASSSCVALLMGGGSAAAIPVCYTGPFPFTNNGALSCITVSATSFTGNVVNSGTGVISPGNPTGILVTNTSTITGQISNAGTISVGGTGIRVDTNSVITNGIVNQGLIQAPGAGIVVDGVSTFGGGISNSGTITGVSAGIAVTNVGTFSAGITNSGTISASNLGIDVCNCDTTFTGGITNAGLIAATGVGIAVSVTNFSGGISNAGTIVSTSRTGIAVFGVRTFVGGITNSGRIVGSSAGIAVGFASTFSGGISNNGTITAGFGNGIEVFAVETFTGGISNSGAISAAGFSKKGNDAIAVFAFSVFDGGIANSGTVSGGGIIVAGGDTFLGGISNSGAITAAGFGGGGKAKGGPGIVVSSVNVFGSASAGGGITNSGTILAPRTGVLVEFVSTFFGGISNSGTISISSGSSRTAISVFGVSTFFGGIANSGRIAMGSSGIAIAVRGVDTFQGRIANSGTIATGFIGIAVQGVGSFGGGISNGGVIALTTPFSSVGITVDNVSLFTGGVLNSGTISGGGAGIAIGECGCGISTFSGGITNTGLIAAAGVGIIVANVTTFDGHIVNAGTISAATAIDTSGALTAITIDQNAGLIAGNILFSSFGDTLNVRGGTINGNIVGQNAGDTINFSLGGGTFTYGAAFGFSNVSFVNVNSGVVVLDGANQAGSIAVNGGVLQIGDAGNPGASLTGSVDVIGGTLSGHGTVVGDVTIESGGVLFPGGSIGTLTIVNGPLTFNPGSTYLVQIAPGAGNNSATAVNGAPGNIAINGGTVLALPQLGHYNATTYTIATATGGVTGTFAGVSFAAPYTYTGTASLSYDLNDVFLNLGAGFALLAPAGTNQNQQSVVNGINGFILGSGSNPPPQFANLATLPGPTLLNALSQLSGEDGAGFQHGALMAGNQFLSLMLNPYLDGRDGFTPAIPFAAEAPPALPDAALAFARFDKAPPRDATLGSGPQFRIWGAAFGGSGTIDGNATVGSQKTTASDAAFAAGVDYLLSRNTTVGFAFAGGGTNWGLGGGLGNGRSDFFQAGVYARQRFGDAYLSGALAYNFHDVTTNRTVTIAGTDMLQGRFQANGLGARLEGGYHFATPFMRVTPYGALQVQSIVLPAYGEAATAGSNQFALNYNSQTATVTRTELGAWFDRAFIERGHLWTVYGRLAWAHDPGNTPRATAIFQALPGSNFVVNGAAPNPDSALVTAGVKYDWRNGWSFLAKFDGEFSSNTSIFSGTGMVRKVW